MPRTSSVATTCACSMAGRTSTSTSTARTRAVSSRCSAGRLSSRDAPAAPRLGPYAKTKPTRHGAGATGDRRRAQALVTPRVRAGSTVPAAMTRRLEARRAERPRVRGACRINAREMHVGHRAPRTLRARVVARALSSRRVAAPARHAQAANRDGRAARGSVGLLGIRQIALVETGAEDDNSLETLVFAAFVRRTA